MSGGGHAANGTAGDGLQLVAHAGAGGGTAALGGQQVAGNGVHHAGGDVDEDLGPGGVHAGDLRRVLIAADGVHIFAVGGLVVDEPEQQAEYQSPGQQVGDAGELLAANGDMGYELEAIAGCTIGGVSTTGGIGTVGGVLVGVLVFELLKIVLQFLGVNPYYNYIVQGLVIVTAVAMDIRKYVAKK